MAIGLLEHQAGRQRQRLVAGITPTQKGRQNQHALGVQCARELDLALDVEHLAFTQARDGRDAAGLAEGEVAQVQHRQAIDLTLHGPLRVDEDDAAQDGLVQLRAHAVVAADLRIHRLLHMGGGHRAMT